MPQPSGCSHSLVLTPQPYFAGEVKQNRKSQILAQLGGTLIFAVFITILIAVEYFGEGPKFVNAIAGMWNNGYSNYPYVAGVPPLDFGDVNVLD